VQKEQCETKVANLLASMDNLSTAEEKIEVLVEAVEELQRQIDLKPDVTVHYDRDQGDFVVREFQMNFMGENWVWFRAKTRNGFNVETLPMKGEI
jgi:hypothetical protein